MFDALRFGTRGDAATDLAERALAFVAEQAQPRLLDLGCGSGGAGIAAALRHPGLTVVALDISQGNVEATRVGALSKSQLTAFLDSNI